MKTILIAEDEELLSQVYEDSLKKDYRVILFHNYLQASDYLKKDKPDLAILDIKLPGVSGLKLLEEMNLSYPGLPVIICTSFDTFRSDYEGLSSKISDYLVKPVVLDELKTKIKNIIGD